jgi:pre-mRNA-splicing factor SYF1
LEENNFFEEAFTAYERGVGLFKWPIVFEIWNAYLAKFIKRYVRGPRSCRFAG